VLKVWDLYLAIQRGYYGILDAIGRAVTRQRLATGLSVETAQNLTSTSDVLDSLASEYELHLAEIRGLGYCSQRRG